MKVGQTFIEIIKFHMSTKTEALPNCQYYLTKVKLQIMVFRAQLINS